ncbi:hypothetical protein PoB_002784000 [Plakobranchus ocellatus]|uniref:Secreted peptide n=1 Tax=Plakobranchus ocellatus TaxID=259542 RepID=A0AAV4A374_9GAST|nr:hypothetical protein PoB_002784000 [Plakobranchus ocellatus]
MLLILVLLILLLLFLSLLFRSLFRVLLFLSLLFRSLFRVLLILSLRYCRWCSAASGVLKHWFLHVSAFPADPSSLDVIGASPLDYTTGLVSFNR